MKKIEINGINDIDRAAKEFLSQFPDDKIFGFYGSMGAGKTTFIKALCKELGVVDTVSSPTFSIVNEYETINGELIYHFDFYRLDSPEEALDFGLYEYIDSEAYCFMEWPEMIEQLLPDNIKKIKIEEQDNGKRYIFEHHA